MSGEKIFSIILPTYNRAETIDISVQSVIKQTFSDWELLIIDDGSTDKTREKVAAYKYDKRIKYFYQPNKERSSARNTGISESCGKYICFIDSDDEFLENHLEVFYNNIIQSKINEGLWFTKTLIRNVSGELFIKSAPSISTINKFAFIMHYTFTPINVCINKVILDKIKFDEKINYAEDMDLWLRIAARDYSICEIPEPTAIYNAIEGMFGLNALKYLHSYKIIFRKKELKNILPNNKKNMLLSKCYFFLAINYKNEKKILKMYFSIIKSFILFPEGYNRKTNKILLVMLLYNIPYIGNFIKFVKNKSSKLN